MRGINEGVSMDLIKAGFGLTKTIRNVGRLKEIAMVFAKNGFDEFIAMGVASKVPNFVLPRSRKSIKEEMAERGERDLSQILGLRLRLCFEELGPAFVKFGQLLSSREDIFDEGFIDEMKLLRDKVKAVPFEEVRKIVEEAIGSPLHEKFKNFEEKPIGTASIGVVHRAVLLDGTEVVVKVRRPGIEQMIATDFSILTFLAEQAERVSSEVRFLGVSRLLRDFGISLQNELNFNVEALNCQRFAANLVAHDKEGLLHLPVVYPEHTTENVLVMEFLRGIPFSNASEIEKHMDDLRPKLDRGVRIFMKTFLSDGFFHADLHGGNFFLLEDGRIGLIDFGLMGSLSKKGRKNFIAIIYSLVTFNYENLVYEFLDVAEYESIPDIDALVSDVRDTLAPYVGLTVQQIDFSILLKSVLEALKRHQIFLPREWFVVFRALITLDGVGRSLGQDFDIYAIMEGDIQSLIKESFNKEELMEEGMWMAKDALSSARILPRHIKWFLKDISKRGYSLSLNLTGYEPALKGIQASVTFLGFAMLAGVFVVSGVAFIHGKSIISWNQVPTICWIFWSLGIASLGRAMLALRGH
jgi:ubiquinone biosynthesis protein